MKEDILKIIIGLILGLFLGLQFKSCGKEKLSFTKQKGEKEVRFVKFTERHITTSSTVDTAYKMSPPKTIYDTVFLNNNNEYVYKIDEKDLQAEIISRLYEDKLDQSIRYSVICPEITKIDSVFIHTKDSTVIEVPSLKTNKLYVGGGANFNNTIIGGNVNLTWQLKNDYQISYSYSLSFNQTVNQNFHMVTLKIPLRLNIK